MIILGIDPGMATTGYAIVETLRVTSITRYDRRLEIKNKKEYEVLDYGVITTKANELNGDRLQEIYEGIGCLIKKFKPDEMAVESLFFCNNQKTAMMVGQARGVVLLAGNQANIQVFDYTPKQVKQSVVGYGVAKKNQVQFMVRRIFDLAKEPKPDDAADALAICYCHGMAVRNMQQIVRTR